MTSRGHTFNSFIFLSIFLVFEHIIHPYLYASASLGQPELDYTDDGPIIVENPGADPITLPAPPSTDIDWDTFPFNSTQSRNILLQNLEILLPAVLHTLEIPTNQIPSLSDHLWPELISTITSLEDVDLPARDLMHSPKPRATVGQQLRCRILAGVTRPAFLIAARRFETLNPGSGSLLSTSPMYFLYPLFPSLFDSLDSAHRVRVYYDAEWVLRRFWGGLGVTFGNKIYLRNQDRLLSSHKDFLSQVLLIAHEVAHVNQYDGYGFSLRKFGHAYLYNWCLAGKKYWDNKMERQAREAADRLSATLMAEENLSFFRFWDRDNRHHSIGLPVELKPRSVEGGMRELGFQRGKMQVRVGDGCYRALEYERGVWSPWNCRIPK